MPCERVVSYAKSAWADAQGSQSAVAHCSVVKRVATINQHAEEHIHPIMAEFGLSLPIPITIISGNLFAEGIPRLKPIDFLHYMSETGNLYRLLGGTSLDKSAAKLTEFWGNFQKIHPDFELFSADTPKEVQWSDCIPIYCHADGGRGFKKSEYMVFNWSSALGNGTGREIAKIQISEDFENHHPRCRWTCWATPTLHISFGVPSPKNCTKTMRIAFKKCFFNLVLIWGSASILE